MTIDGGSSIYVGGIPYDSTEDVLRRIFEVYGSILSVKVFDDHNIGGECYAFVTFTHPRPAMQAIAEIHGQTVDGRVIRVSEVRAREQRSDFSYRRNSDRNIGNSRERDDDHDREHSQENDQWHYNLQDQDRVRESFWGRDHDLERSYSNERGKRGCPSELRDDEHSQVTRKLKIQELKKEIARMEEIAEEKRQVVLKLREKSEKLEDSLAAAKREKSYREKQLAKLIDCYQLVRNCSENLKQSELELQSACKLDNI